MEESKMPTAFILDDFREDYSSAERNEFYEGCLKTCGNCKGKWNTWVCLCCPDVSPYRRIPEGNFAVIQEFGKFVKVVGPGLQYVNPLTQTLSLVDKRERTVDLRRQNLLTKDNVTVLIDAVIYYKVMNPYKALFGIENLDFAIKEIARTTLKDVIGNTLLQDTFENREKMAVQIRDIIDRPTIAWGVDVTRVLVQEILLAPDLQSNLSTAAVTKRTAEGKIILAQADVDSAKLMREASDILNTPAAMQIRYLDAITDLAKSGNTKVVLMPPQAGKDTSTDVKALRKFLIQSELN